MTELEKAIEQLAKKVYTRVREDHIDIEYDEFVRICIGFSKFKDGGYEIPFNVLEVIHVCKKLGFKDILVGGTQIILLTSIIETLTRRVRYKKFEKWYKENSEYYKDKKCLQAYADYNKIHGSRKNFRNFFHSNLTKDEKIGLLTKIKIKYNDDIFEPFCFQDKESCFYRSDCKGRYHMAECPAINDEKIMRIGIKKLANYFYELRNNFVHQARIPTFSYPFFNWSGRTITSTYVRTEDYEGECIIEINPEDLFKLVMKYLPKLLNDYLDEVE